MYANLGYRILGIKSLCKGIAKRQSPLFAPTLRSWHYTVKTGIDWASRLAEELAVTLWACTTPSQSSAGRRPLADGIACREWPCCLVQFVEQCGLDSATDEDSTWPTPRLTVAPQPAQAPIPAGFGKQSNALQRPNRPNALEQTVARGRCIRVAWGEIQCCMGISQLCKVFTVSDAMVTPAENSVRSAGAVESQPGSGLKLRREPQTGLCASECRK